MVNEMPLRTKIGKHWKKLVLALALIAVGSYITWHLVNDARDEFALNQRGKITIGYPIDCSEDATSTTSFGEDIYEWYVEYTYRIPDGREFTQTQIGRGFIDPNLCMNSYPLKVEYLPNDPEVSRLKDYSNSESLLDFLRDKFEDELLIIALYIAGIWVLRGAVQDIKDD